MVLFLEKVAMVEKLFRFPKRGQIPGIRRHASVLRKVLRGREVSGFRVFSIFWLGVLDFSAV